ncbi:AAA family ATPase [Salipaludibacillus daqingensis]|uniref:AAA family ATPase n=1 Tax=Salipaludibacillus daqingensis TaxID=3041001 RepID=UPI002473A234|nr:AAA family ATPase [Salipaludibacillus daqingensis]
MSVDNKILLICDQEEIRNRIIQETLQSNDNVEINSSKEVKKEIGRIAPDVVIFVAPNNGSEVELIQYINNESQGFRTPVILFVTEEENFLQLRDVIRAGASDFFVFPDEFHQFNERFEKIQQVVKNQKESVEETAATSGKALKRGRGQVISFYSGKGGVGRTLLSSTFAQTLKFESTAEVLLIDLNLQFGGVETFLGIESNRSLADLKPVINELNENHIRNVSEKEPLSKLELLLSPQDAEAAESILDEHVTQLIRSCRRIFDFVIIDLPTEMNAKTYAVLEESDLIYYVMKLDTPSIRVYQHVDALFDRLGMDTTDRIQIVINEKERNNELNAKDLQEFIPLPVATEIRRDMKGVQGAVNKGVPLRQKVRERKIPLVAKDVRKWVSSKLK